MQQAFFKGVNRAITHLKPHASFSLLSSSSSLNPLFFLSLSPPMGSRPSRPTFTHPNYILDISHIQVIHPPSTSTPQPRPPHQPFMPFFLFPPPNAPPHYHHRPRHSTNPPPSPWPLFPTTHPLPPPKSQNPYVSPPPRREPTPTSDPPQPPSPPLNSSTSHPPTTVVPKRRLQQVREKLKPPLPPSPPRTRRRTISPQP